MGAPANKKEKSFEAALKRLEEIVSEMERGDLSLDATLKKFNEGMGLSQFCSRKLDEAEKKIEILVKKEGGSKTREFLASSEAAPDRESSKEGFEGDEETPEEEGGEDGEPLF